MRLTITVLFICFSTLIYGQVSNKSLTGNWIKTRIIFKNGEQLPDDKVIKSEYIKYIFGNPNSLSMSFDFKYKGTAMLYELTGNLLEIKNSYGYLTNSFLVETVNDQQLVLLQKGQEGFDSPDCLRYYFTREALYQQAIPLTSSDVIGVKEKDTLYKASAKIYAVYKGENDFHDYLKANISEYDNVQSTNSHFVATYIVNELGAADSVHILESINSSFDRQFLKAFNKTKKDWQPASLNGKKIPVQMTEEFRFISGDNFLPNYDYSRKGNEAMKQSHFDEAIYYFDKALEKYPDNLDNLYHRAVCKLSLGNKTGACEDLNRIKQLGSSIGDSLLEKNCK
jgi:tetratricopeptide (TPR) repeat protein